jgi:hypothetical protein
MNETNEALATRSPGSGAVQLPHPQKMIDETNETLAA